MNTTSTTILMRSAIAAVRACADTMECQAESLLQALLRLPMEDELRARVMQLVDGLRDASGRVTFELALMQAEVGAGAADAERLIKRLTGMDALMMNALATFTDVVEELERAAERDEINEPAYVRVIEATGVLLQGVKSARSATEALHATLPRTRAPVLRMIPPPPVRAAADGSVVILQAGAEGGDVTLIGRATAAGTWVFARVTDDQTEALFGESGDGVVQGPSFENLEWVDTWEDALRLMDRYRWARLHPLEVHPAFLERVRAAVEVRLAQEEQDRWTEHARGKWERLFLQAKSRSV